jgi:anti-repressor protein
MGQLIKIQMDDQGPVMSAKELHQFLEIKTSYKVWFPRMAEYGFTEKQNIPTTSSNWTWQKRSPWSSNFI